MGCPRCGLCVAPLTAMRMSIVQNTRPPVYTSLGLRTAPSVAGALTADCRGPPSFFRQQSVTRGGPARAKPLAGGHAATFAALEWPQARVSRALATSPLSQSPGTLRPSSVKS